LLLAPENKFVFLNFFNSFQQVCALHAHAGHTRTRSAQPGKFTLCPVGWARIKEQMSKEQGKSVNLMAPTRRPNIPRQGAALER